MISEKRGFNRGLEKAPKQKHGEWFDRGSLSCRCSNCGCKSPQEYDFCPNCKADMRGKAGRTEELTPEEIIGILCYDICVLAEQSAVHVVDLVSAKIKGEGKNDEENETPRPNE